MSADFDLESLDTRQREMRSLVKAPKIDPEFFRLKTRVNRPKKPKFPQEETAHE